MKGSLKHPGTSYRVDGHRRTHSVIYQTARADLLGLVSLGLLEQTKEGRAFVFTAPRDLSRRMKELAAQSLKTFSRCQLRKSA